MRLLYVRSALHLNSQPISRVVTLGVAGVQVPNVLFSIHYSLFTLFNYSVKVMKTVNQWVFLYKGSILHPII